MDYYNPKYIAQIQKRIMIKIDFHIHTVATKSDAHFTFDINVIQKYINEASLDAIAITNHNMFDLEQYIKIKEVTDKKVFPGIEINLEDGHLLLISKEDDLYDFNEKCREIDKQIILPEDSVSIDSFKSIFLDLNKYILIPHYNKRPSLSDQYIKELSPYIKAGEVNSPKKFTYCIKDDSKLVPVYFSDSRMKSNLENMPVRQTFLACEEVSFGAIKNCLSDKRSVFLSPQDGNNLFSIFDDGQQLSTGLNVVLGERSSGKSYTLNKIHEEYNTSEQRAKYIKQFSLVNRSDEKDAEYFNKSLREKSSLLSSEYLKKFKEVVDDMMEVDLKDDEKKISSYIESLLKNATESAKQDSYSKAKLFNEENFFLKDQENLEKLIASTKNLIANGEYEEIIKKYISTENLIKLYVELMQEYANQKETILKKEWVNEIIGEVKNKLRLRTASTPIEAIDFYQVAMNLKRVEKFETITDLARPNKVFKSKKIQGFEVVARADRFKNTSDLKKLSGIRSSFSNAFQKYDQPYEFLQELKKIEGLPESEYHKFFVNIDYQILNEDGSEVSGGQRSEFNLLQEIEDAQKYDILLIDEPESSFDNLFLKREVNELIRDISKNMPVVLVTHNSTVGSSINPNYILYTEKTKIDGKPKYRIYSGDPSNRYLKSTDGKRINTFNVTIDCLEAGEDTYNKRKESYENLKNRE